MKITLEINTANLHDVIEAIDTLKPLLPKDMNSSGNDKFKIESNEKLDKVLHKENINIISNEEYLKIKSELEKANALIAKIEKEKEIALSENESILEKLKSLEVRENIESIELEDVIGKSNESSETKDESLEKIRQEYESKIEALNKSVTFHESRSNKNFEEIKRLRVLVDNITVEKRNLEKKVNLLEKENEDLKELTLEDKTEEVEKLSSENKNLMDKLDSLEKDKEKLNKEIEFQKNRNKTNWEELKSVKSNCESLTKENDIMKRKVDDLNKQLSSNSSNEDIEKIKLDFVQIKSEYESTISELKLSNDKLQNEINLYANNFSDESLEELEHLRKIKRIICGNEKGATFWNGVESNINKL